MATDRTPAKPGSDFNTGIREHRQARVAREDLDIAPPTGSGEEAPGFDPYNSSGSFDRRKNWERVRKR